MPVVHYILVNVLTALRPAIPLTGTRYKATDIRFNSVTTLTQRASVTIIKKHASHTLTQVSKRPESMPVGVLTSKRAGVHHPFRQHAWPSDRAFEAWQPAPSCKRANEYAELAVC